MNGPMNARKLRVILLVAMVLIVAAMAGGFVYAQRSLNGFAQAISQLNADANTGDQSIATLRNLEERIDREQGTIAAARGIVADSSTFAEKVVGDVTRSAAEAGVSISTIEYVDTPATGTTPTAAATPSAATPTAPTAPTSPGVATQAPATPAIAKKSISVTLASPISYTKLMDFIKKIETNQVKLQIASVSLKKDAGGNVTTQAFSIGAYVR